MKEKITTIRAGVNEGNFFAAVQHVFTDSTSFLGELMQNARRARATQVQFDFNPKSKTLRVIDDGVGVEEFSKLLEFGASGWDEQTKAQETPFGMGMYSVFFAGKSTTVCSRGQQVTITVDDLIARRPLAIEPSQWTQRGTLVVVDDLQDSLCKSEFASAPIRIHAALKQAAKGFAVDVQYNGEMLPRPHAASAVDCVNSPIGSVHLTPSLCSKYHAYLQGLPIESNCSWREDDVCVLHLDNAQFSARMPDRSALYDRDLQRARIEKTLKDVLCEKLAAEKTAAVASSDATALPAFVEARWKSCVELGAAKLLNDIPYVPEHLLWVVDCVSAYGAHVLSRRARKYGSVHASDLCSDHKILAVRAAPDDSTVSPRAASLLTAMQAFDIVAVDAQGLDAEHWLNQLPAADDIDIDVKAFNPTGTEFSKWCGSAWVNDLVVRDCEAIILRIKHGDLVQSMELHNNWIVTAERPDGTEVSQDDWDSSDHDVLCWVTGSLSYQNLPTDAVQSFAREHTDHDSEDRDMVADEFMREMRAIRNETLRDTVATALCESHLIITEAHATQVCLVTVAENKHGRRELTVTEANKRFFDACSRLLQSAGHAISSESLATTMQQCIVAIDR